MNYEDRKAAGYIFSFAGEDENILNTGEGYSATSDDDKRESLFNLDSCAIRNIPQNEKHLFSINERDDMKGFNVDMRGLKIAKSSALIVESCPKWLEWILIRACKAW